MAHLLSRRPLCDVRQRELLQLDPGGVVVEDRRGHPACATRARCQSC